MKKRKVIGIAGLLFGIVAFWYMATTIGGIRDIFLPAPGKTFAALFGLLKDYEFWLDLGTSWYRIFLGFLISFAIAYPVALVSLAKAEIRDNVFYLVEFFRYLPVPIFIPLTILWFGVDDASKIIIIVLGTFAQMIPMFYDSARIIENKFDNFNYSLKWSRWSFIKNIVIPGSAPGILDNSRICLGWAWTYLIVAEIVGAEHGIGYAMIRAQRYLATDKIFAYIIVIGIIGVVTDRTLLYARKRVYPWHK